MADVPKKLWKDSQKAVDRLSVDFDAFIIEMDKRDETYKNGVSSELKDTDPVYQYAIQMMEKLNDYTWVII